MLDEILQPRWDNRAAKRLLRRLIKSLGLIPKRIIKDKLRSYRAANREVAPDSDHWSHKGLNNRAEYSHLTFRKQEMAMQGHRSPGGLQSFVPTHSATRNCFRTPVRLRSALTIRYTASKQLAHGMPQRNQPEIHKTAFLGGAGS